MLANGRRRCGTGAGAAGRASPAGNGHPRRRTGIAGRELRLIPDLVTTIPTYRTHFRLKSGISASLRRGSGAGPARGASGRGSQGGARGAGGAAAQTARSPGTPLLARTARSRDRGRAGNQPRHRQVNARLPVPAAPHRYYVQADFTGRTSSALNGDGSGGRHGSLFAAGRVSGRVSHGGCRGRRDVLCRCFRAREPSGADLPVQAHRLWPCHRLYPAAASSYPRSRRMQLPRNRVALARCLVRRAPVEAWRDEARRCLGEPKHQPILGPTFCCEPLGGPGQRAREYPLRGQKRQPGETPVVIAP